MNLAKKTDLLLSFSLPKTGTTYFEAALNRSGAAKAPSIKEPSFFFERNKSTSIGIYSKAALVDGNYKKGHAWYSSLYKQSYGESRIDFSTQYWLYMDEVYRNAMSHGYNLRILSIYRKPEDQLISYISHLRRGYIGEEKLEHVCDRDRVFYDYIVEMSRWKNSIQEFKQKNESVMIHECDFEEITMDVLACVRKIFPDIESSPEVENDVNRNEMSHPRYKFLNRILFSEFARTIGRSLPMQVYAPIVRLRKDIVKKNLVSGKGRQYAEDLAFIRKYVL